MKKKTLKSLREEAWSLMSEYSRRKDGEYTTCFTCGKSGHWKEFDAGHLWHASKQNEVTYDDRNIHAQCRACNYFAKDARIVGGLYVEKRYGEGTVEELRLKKSQSKVLRMGDLELVIERLQQKLAGLE